MDIRVDVAKSVVVSGGSSMFEGFGDRLKSELVKLAPHLEQDIEVVNADDGKNGVWRGTSKFAAMSNFASSMMITKEEYDEQGSAIVNTNNWENQILHCLVHF